MRQLSLTRSFLLECIWRSLARCLLLRLYALLFVDNVLKNRLRCGTMSGLRLRIRGFPFLVIPMFDAYTDSRFLIVVLSAYKQIRAQSTDVLSDIDEDNFDKAFKFLRPVIQGGADMGHRISEDELQRALDFCGKLFSPTTPDEHEAARTLLETCEYGDGDRGVMDVRAPVIHPSKIAQLSEAASRDRETVDVKMVLEKVNARRVIHSEHGSGVNNFEDEALGGVGSLEGDEEGFVVKLVRGELGLVKA